MGKFPIRLQITTATKFLNLIQAWYLTEATEAIASVAPGLCLGALSKVPIEIYKFLIEVPFAKEKSPCPFKYEVSGLLICLSISASPGIIWPIQSMPDVLYYISICLPQTYANEGLRGILSKGIYTGHSSPLFPVSQFHGAAIFSTQIWWAQKELWLGRNRLQAKLWFHLKCLRHRGKKSWIWKLLQIIKTLQMF